MPKPRPTPRSWVTWHLAHGEDVTATCQYFGISRATLYRWLKQYRENPKKPLKRQSRRPKTRRPPGYTVRQLFAVALLHNKNPSRGRKRTHAILTQWHQHEHGEGDPLGLRTTDLSYLTSQAVPSDATVGRMLTIIRRRCPFCQGPKGRPGAKNPLVNPMFQRTEGHISLGCTWAVMGLPPEVFDQRLPLAKLRKIVRESKAKHSWREGKAETTVAAQSTREKSHAAEQAVNCALMEQQIDVLMRQIEDE